MHSSFSRSVLITGGTSGLGYCCAAEIARQHPEYQVVIAARSDVHGSAESINKTLNQNNVTFMPLDLSDNANVRSFVTQWEQADQPPIQALLLNAGLQFPGSVQYTATGIEKTFATNHVGHALLFSLLQPHLSSTARIVITSSATHDPAQKTGMPEPQYTTAEELARPTPASAHNPGRQRYTASKLVNVLWMYALHRRFRRLPEKKKWTVVAYDPGLMPGTGLAREAGPFVGFLWHQVLPRLVPLLRRLHSPNVFTPAESGAALAWIAVSEAAAGESGVYYEQRRTIATSAESYDEAKQEDLWRWTVEHIAASEEERSAFEVVA